MIPKRQRRPAAGIRPLSAANMVLQPVQQNAGRKGPIAAGPAAAPLAAGLGSVHLSAVPLSLAKWLSLSVGATLIAAMGLAGWNMGRASGKPGWRL